MPPCLRGEINDCYIKYLAGGLRRLRIASPLGVAGCLAAMLVLRRRRNDKGAFLSSSAYLVFMLVGAAAAVYPNLLTSTTDPALNITVHNAAAGSYALSVGLIFGGLGMAIAVGYFVFVYRMFKGKVDPSQGSSYIG